MRILTVGNMYPPHHLGGYELMWLASVESLRSAGADVRVLTTDYRGARSGPSEERDVVRELRWYWKNHSWPRLTMRERLALERHNQEIFDREASEFRPDVVAWWSMGGMSLALVGASRNRKIPSAAVVLDDWLLYAPAEDQWQRVGRRLGPFGRLAGRALGVPTGVGFDRSVHWGFISETVRQRARAQGWELANSRVINVGIDPDLFTEHPVRPWDGTLLYAGRIDRRKGIDVALRALALVDETTLIVDGSGDDGYLSDLRAECKRLGIEERVTFQHSERADLPRVYAACDAVIFPVLWEEPFGLVPLEAMAVGTPVIATGTGGSGEYLRDGENCRIYRPADDPRALADAVRELRADESLRTRLRLGGRHTAPRFTQAQFTSGVQRLIEDAAGARA